MYYLFIDIGLLKNDPIKKHAAFLQFTYSVREKKEVGLPEPAACKQSSAPNVCAAWTAGATGAGFVCSIAAYDIHPFLKNPDNAFIP